MVGIISFVRACKIIAGINSKMYVPIADVEWR